MTATRTPTVGDIIACPRVTTVPFEITKVFGADESAYSVQGRDTNGVTFSLALYQGEYGTANGWEYAR